MDITPKRDFKIGERVYVVDYWNTGNGTEAIGTEADILLVDEEDKVFTGLLYGDTTELYSFNDYGRLIFDTLDEAVKAAEKIPKPGTKVHQTIGKKVYTKTVENISGQYIDGVYDLIIIFDKGSEVSIKEIGQSLIID